MSRRSAPLSAVNPCRFRQRLRIGAEELNPKRPVGGRRIEVTAGLAHPPDEAVGADHLGKGEAAAELTHNRPERQIGDPRHRGEKDVRSSNVTDRYS